MRLGVVAALAVALVTASLLTTSSPRPESKALEIVFLVGDRCFFNRPWKRPVDCYEDPPCMWVDADLLLREGAAGGYEVGASTRGWIDGMPQPNPLHGTPPPSPPRRHYFQAHSIDALAQTLPAILERLHDAPPAVRDACVMIRPDQSMRLGDVMAFHAALNRQRLHRADFQQVLADDWP